MFGVTVLQAIAAVVDAYGHIALSRPFVPFGENRQGQFPRCQRRVAGNRAATMVPTGSTGIA